MKKILFGVAALSLLGLASVGVELKTQDAIEAKADSYSGTIFLELGTDDWKSSAFSIGLYLMNSDKSQNTWGTLQTSYGGKYLDYNYSGVSFEPAYCIVMRVKKDTSNWGGSIWSNEDLYARTGDLGLSGKDTVYVGNYTKDKYVEASSYLFDRGFIRGGEYKDWSSTTINIELPHLKVASGGTMEAYGEVTLAKSSIKGQKGTSDVWSQTWSCHSSLESVFGGTSGNGNVDVAVGGKYTVYFNYDSTNIYFTTATLAEADEWAQTFLAGVTCDGNGSITKDGWTTLSGTYAALDDDVKAIFTGIAEDGNDSGTYAEKAVCRYDYIVKKYGTTAKPDFMGRKAAGKIDPKASYSFTALNDGGDNTMAITIGISGIATLALCGAFLLRKRKAE